MAKERSGRGKITGKIVIAIDGPAGAGKSTVARGAASRLGYLYLDTGAMYRAVALKVLRRGLNRDDTDRIIELLSRIELDLKAGPDGLRVLLDGEDVSDEIRSPEVSGTVTWVCQIPEVRRFLVAHQRLLGADGGVVAEGRDVGTVVFPEAEVKIYLDADINTRAGRRLGDLKSLGHEANLDSVAEDIKSRDRADINREMSPLTAARDAVRIDTGNLTPEEVIERVVRKAEAAIGRVKT